MTIKYTIHFLAKMEDVFSESNYLLRYEKGNFKSGYCILKEQNVIIVNKYYPLEGKINCLVDILKTLPIDTSRFKEKSKELYHQITQTSLVLQ
ncbi:MAG: hypothetical protein EAZ27_12535 [Cytophagales bacterium]|nr:MAG: hypothetical protein EAZ27_12535 [Cytophagales bacterium]